ncbi:MAG: hypothetical protein QOE14_977 [Humisphaera sp.]|nr:hypothetical protein [Humisphaera sp.]
MTANASSVVRAGDALGYGTTHGHAARRVVAGAGRGVLMSVAILQVDLAQPLPTLQTGGRRGGAQWILVKLGPQPLGWVCCDAKQFGESIGPDALLKLIYGTLSRRIQLVSRERGHDKPIALTRTPFSIVICTRGGAAGAALERQLQGIAKLRTPSFEVIVVDRAAAANLAGVCETFPFVRYAHDPRSGVNYARNTGWQLARGEIVAYLDDNAIVDPHWLNALAANYDDDHGADSQVNCVTGLVLPREVNAEPREQDFSRHVYRAGTWNTTFPFDAVTRVGGGVNLSVRRQTLETMGGFDVALSGRGGELDLFVRILRDGGAIVHDPRAICFGAIPTTSGQLRQRMFDDGIAFTSCCAKHAYDLELGNHAIRMLARWFRQRLVAAVRPRQRDFSCDAVVAEMVGGVIGLRAYGRAARRVRRDQPKFSGRDMTPREIPLRGAAAANRKAA